MGKGRSRFEAFFLARTDSSHILLLGELLKKIERKSPVLEDARAQICGRCTNEVKSEQ
jgi:hypothetical protein